MSSPSSPGQIVIISGPSGVGKTTIAHEMEKRLKGVFSVSMTTREQTVKDGRDYRFVTHEQFQKELEQGNFLEWAEVFGQCYGTPQGPVDQAVEEGKTIFLEIDVQGAIQVKTKRPEALAIFILPPDEPTLLKRLRERKRESEEKIQKRFAEATREIGEAHACGVYDHFVTNDDLAAAMDRAEQIIRDRKG
ncbi:guanylate kinase [Mucisphaera sp.]|uniref:guanylate kinase n=1 Tax=Mucisphaera sp. TaxID=2913024 RepID=UPI003D137931